LYAPNKGGKIQGFAVYSVMSSCVWRNIWGGSHKT
jgi:hypothetical protein